MRILLVHSGADLYGASRSLLRLSSRLVHDRHTVVALLPYVGPLRDALIDAGVDVRIEPTLSIVTRTKMRQIRQLLGLPFQVVRSALRLSSIIRVIRPNIIHTNTAILLSPGVAARLSRVPHLWHVRESFGEFGRAWVAYQWYMFFFSTKIACVSEAIRQQYAPFVRSRKTLTIHNGIPASEFPFVPEDRVRDFRSAYGLEGFILVGVIGRLKMVRKGQDTFLKAAAMIADAYPNVRFILIGSTFPGNESHAEALTALSRSLGIADRVVFTGDVRDIKAAYAALDIAVLPSEQPEPFGGVVIESMASSKPVVGTKVGGTSEQIEDGLTGLLVKPGDPKAMANAIQRLLDDPSLRRRMGEQGRKRFEERFEFERFYGRILNIYHDISDTQ